MICVAWYWIVAVVVIVAAFSVGVTAALYGWLNT